MTNPTVLFVSALIFFFSLDSVKEAFLLYQNPSPLHRFWIPSSNLLKDFVPFGILPLLHLIGRLHPECALFPTFKKARS